MVPSSGREATDQSRGTGEYTGGVHHTRSTRLMARLDFMLLLSGLAQTEVTMRKE